MKLKIFDLNKDKVIKGTYVTAKMSYKDAIENLIQLINKYDEQRNPIQGSIYNNLRRDITKGCIMPPLTLAFVEDINLKSNKEAKEYIESNISKAYILDGIQRLNNLNILFKENKLENILALKNLYVNILICPSKDKLLYRMITLNNGQKPMSARHQIEILSSNLYDFNSLKIKFKTEKNSKSIKTKAIKKSILIKGYLAFSTNTINIDNTKIIDEMMDSLIVDKIFEQDISERKYEFQQIIDLIIKLSETEIFKKWIESENNFIGFCSAINKSFDIFNNLEKSQLENKITNFEKAFSSLNRSKIRLGIARRKIVNDFIGNFSKYQDSDIPNMLNEFSMII